MKIFMEVDLHLQKWEVFHSALERWNTVERLEHLPHSRAVWNGVEWHGMGVP